jgi:hypothetical protein
VLEEKVPLSNQAEKNFHDDNNKQTNKQTKQELDQNKIYLCGYLCCSGSLGCDDLVR